MYITLYPSPSVIPLCSLASFGLELSQSVRFAAWGIARSCPFTADLQKKICHYLSQTQTSNSISCKIENVTTDIRCLQWEEKAQNAERGNSQFPAFIVLTSCCGKSSGSDAGEVQLVYQVMRVNLKSLEAYCKRVLLMPWMKSWLSI